MKKLFAIVISGLMLSGCAVDMPSSGVISTKNFNLNSPGLVKGKFVYGSASLDEDRSEQRAVENALSHPCAVALSDARFKSRFEVEGIEILDTTLAGCAKAGN